MDLEASEAVHPNLRITLLANAAARGAHQVLLVASEAAAADLGAAPLADDAAREVHEMVLVAREAAGTDLRRATAADATATVMAREAPTANLLVPNFTDLSKHGARIPVARTRFDTQSKSKMVLNTPKDAQNISKHH